LRSGRAAAERERAEEFCGGIDGGGGDQQVGRVFEIVGGNNVWVDKGVGVQEIGWVHEFVGGIKVWRFPPRRC